MIVLELEVNSCPACLSRYMDFSLTGGLANLSQRNQVWIQAVVSLQRIMDYFFLSVSTTPTATARIATAAAPPYSRSDLPSGKRMGFSSPSGDFSSE